MPAPITSLSSSRTVNKVATLKPRSSLQVKKTRIVRPRGRAKDAGSDDEFEREVGTDSELEDELSSTDSDSDSDTEPASEDVIPNGRPRAFTPNTSQSPGDRSILDKNAAAQLSAASFFNPVGNWSEMVADENTNGPADLPVIEFADFDGQDIPQAALRSRKAKKPVKAPRPASSSPVPPHLPLREDDGNEAGEPELVASTSRHSPSPSSFRRPAGQTARQAYQHRLESDPSYVPTVGGFWGHDDRLLDKDLRSLSGWWRGRWQGRGRGFTRGRGRGGFFAQAPRNPSDTNAVDDEHALPDAADVPPIERAWTHDGFEEMKRREERRRQTQETQPQGTQSLRGGAGFRRGRGYASARGRGGFNRGGFMASPTRSRVSSPFGKPGRIWFGMKPELMWTKQHEAFLHFDSSLKPRQGQGPGFRVKIPGSHGQVIRAPYKHNHNISKVSATKPSTASVLGSDHGEKTYTVCLPNRHHTESGAVEANEASLEDVFTVRSGLVERNPISLPESASITDATSTAPEPSRDLSSLPPDPSAPSSSRLDVSIRSQLEQLSLEPQQSDPARWAQTEEAVLKNPPSEALVEPRENERRPSLPAIQTVFTPSNPQPSPAFTSQYGYVPTLPPGIAMNQHGMPYELATGRPVYLQPHPPMYNPRPVMQSHMTHPSIPFIPGHMHHHSTVSPDFLAHSHSTSHTPSMNGFIDPSTGTPIFSFPRQTSRIEIRAPPENSEAKPSSKSSTHRTSGLRTSATVFEPSRPSEHQANGYFPSLVTPDPNTASYALNDGAEGGASESDSHGNQQHMVDSSVVAYPHYPQQYYYPEAYGYPPYVDMTQGQYEMYPADALIPQGTIYY